MKAVCFGLLVVFFCQSGEAPVASDFCQIAGPQIRAFYQLTDAELKALQPARKRAMLKLRRNFEQQCK